MLSALVIASISLACLEGERVLLPIAPLASLVLLVIAARRSGRRLMRFGR